MVDLYPYQGIFEHPVLPSFVCVGISCSSIPQASSITLELLDKILDGLDDEFVSFTLWWLPLFFSLMERLPYY